MAFLKKENQQYATDMDEKLSLFYKNANSFDYYLDMTIKNNIEKYMNFDQRQHYINDVGTSEKLDELMINFITLQTIVNNRLPEMPKELQAYEKRSYKKDGNYMPYAYLPYRPYFVLYDFTKIPYPGNMDVINNISYHTFLRSNDFVRTVNRNREVKILIKKEFVNYAVPIDREIAKINRDYEEYKANGKNSLCGISNNNINNNPNNADNKNNNVNGNINFFLRRQLDELREIIGNKKTVKTFVTPDDMLCL